jgi:unconventional prefoldin RPB5 interactor 1
MPGKLINTNEILVLLGDNWFVERSAKQACGIIDRRIIGIDDFLEKLNKEKTALNEAIEWTENIMKVNLRIK